MPNIAVAQKECTRCRQVKSITGFGSDYRQPCLCCRSEQRRDPDERRRQYQRHKRWVAANRERVKETYRQWEAANIDTVRRKQRERYAKPENKAKASAAAKAFAAANPEHARAKRVNAKAKRRQRGLTRKITAAEMAALMARDRICYLCGRKNTPDTQSVDHVVPLARGGLHEFINLKLVHLECNLKKRDKLILLPFEVAS